MPCGPLVPGQVGEVLHAGPSGMLPTEVAVELARKPPRVPAHLAGCLPVSSHCGTLRHAAVTRRWEAACWVPARLSGIHLQGAQAEPHWCACSGAFCMLPATGRSASKLARAHRTEKPFLLPDVSWQRRDLPHVQLQYHQGGKWGGWAAERQYSDKWHNLEVSTHISLLLWEVFLYYFL